MSRDVFIVILLLLVLSPGVMAYLDNDVGEENDSVMIKSRYVEETAQREFIVDAPYRVEPGQSVPIFFEIRDAYGSSYWEYSFYGVEIYDGNNRDRLVKRFSCTDLGLPIDSDSYCTVDTRTWHTVKYLRPNLFEKDENDDIRITAKYDGCGFPDGDAEPDNEPYPLVVYVGDEGLSKIPNWYCGDTHYHSSYTDTKFVASLAGEFGGPLDETIAMLDVLNLDWVTVTDHSNSFSRHKDDNIGLSWDDFKIDCNNYDKCLIGTEINCDYGLVGGGNHLLSYDYSVYIEDSFVDMLSPDNPSCAEMISNVYGQGGFTYAAHPESIFDPFGAIVNTWHDYSLPFSGLQVWNGDIGDEESGVRVIEDLENGIEKWKDVLLGRDGLEARKVYVSAGSDAHGDFQNFGREYTCCYAEEYSKENIFGALENGNCYMGNNGAFVFEVDNLHGDIAILGEEINVLEGGDAEMIATLFVEDNCELSLYRGIVEEGIESKVYSADLEAEEYVYRNPISFSKLGLDTDLRVYYRFDCVTPDGKNRVYTNPIWVNPIECFEDADCDADYSASSCEGDRFCDISVDYSCRNPGEDDSYCFEDRVEDCEDCRFGCEADGCVSVDLCRVNSPVDGDVFEGRNILFDVLGVEGLETIEYIDYSSSWPRWRWLCRDCDEYVGSKIFGEGEHDVSVRCSDSFGNEEYELDIFVDSLSPVILRVEPNRGFSNGSFSVVFREANPSKVFLYYGGFVEEVNIDDCVEDGRNWRCDVSVDLSDGVIEYWFVVEDVAGRGVESDRNEVVVDSVAPVVNNPDSFWERGTGWRSSNVYFDISVTEDNFDEVVVMYDSWGRTRERILCSRLDDGVCEKIFRARSWYSNVRIVVRDEAGNWVEHVVEL